jgi:hypothetical protein
VEGIKRKIPLLGRNVDVVEVPVKSAKEYFNEYELEDGTVLRVKGVAAAFQRVEGERLPDGRPIYIVLMSPVVNVLSSPLTNQSMQAAIDDAEK